MVEAHIFACFTRYIYISKFSTNKIKYNKVLPSNQLFFYLTSQMQNCYLRMMIFYFFFFVINIINPVVHARNVTHRQQPLRW